jgi:hypothetical protein
MNYFLFLNYFSLESHMGLTRGSLALCHDPTEDWTVCNQIGVRDRKNNNRLGNRGIESRPRRAIGRFRFSVISHPFRFSYNAIYKRRNT